MVQTSERFRRLELPGYEGGLITWDDKFEGTVLVNCRNRRERQRFTIGHELGHFLNPWHQPPNEEGFRCTAKDMRRSEADNGNRVVRMEAEANTFAAELLFPRRPFVDDLRRRAGLDLEHILDLAGRYDMSKEATARRYVALQDELCAVVFSHKQRHPLLAQEQGFSRDRGRCRPTCPNRRIRGPSQRTARHGFRLGRGRRRNSGWNTREAAPYANRLFFRTTAIGLRSSRLPMMSRTMKPTSMKT